MAINFQDEKRIFTIQTTHSTYQMMADKHGFLLHLYYGKRVEGELDYLLTHYDRGFSGNPYDAGEDRTYSMDTLPQEYPSLGNGDYRNAALVICNHDGSRSCDLRYKSHRIEKGKYGLKGLPAVYAGEEAQTLEIVLEDSVTKVQVVLLYGVLPEDDIITRSVKIINQGEHKIVVEKAASACLDFVNGNYDLLSFYGRHAMERNLQRTSIGHGTQVLGSRRGTSSHQYNPAVIVAEKDTTEDAGSCYGMVFVYSGNFQFEAEQDQFNQTRALMGLQREYFSYPLEQKEELIVPETILAYSGEGLGHLSHLYHRCIREHVCRGAYKNQIRPILVNSWEASYFDFTGETICKLARDAAELGMDMVVMDDGWFGKRDDDNSGLGDWYVNERKLGCTLGEMIEKINAAGVKFGIWIEPEMVSEDSDLYRAHPDWAIKIPGRKPNRSRNQLVLDFSREEVREHIFEQICKILEQGNIEYVKWDMNRSLSDIYSATTDCGKVMYDYVLGLYDFLEKLNQRYPQILIEGCSGGGGRFDAGMMYYTPQIWCSDNTDAMDRIRIQYGTSFFYPASTVGSHVSAVPNHQTGRKTALFTRGTVAMAGTFGYELDLGKLSREEKEEIKLQIQEYKKNAELIQKGTYYRLSNPYQEEQAAWMFVSENQEQALISVVMQEIHGNMPVTYVKLKGLKPDAVYENVESKEKRFGSAWMNAGIPIPVEMEEYRAYRIELQECRRENI